MNSVKTQANDGSYLAATSANGRSTVFDSTASSLVANDTNAVSDVFIRGPL